MTQSGNYIADHLFKDTTEVVIRKEAVGDSTQSNTSYLQRVLGGCRGSTRQGRMEGSVYPGWLPGLEEGRLAVPQPFEWSLGKLGGGFSGPWGGGDF